VIRLDPATARAEACGFIRCQEPFLAGEKVPDTFSPARRFIEILKATAKEIAKEP
jgi:hypothetical protein